MKAIVISGASSNSGKTSISMGIIRSLRKKGLDISAFKIGPDYIDSYYLGLAAGKRAGNLDLHMMGDRGLGESLGYNMGEIGIIESAMGHYDGIGNSYENSGHDIAKKLKLATVLVYRPEGEMFTAIVKILGLINFPGANIEGIIFNGVTKRTYEMLSQALAQNTDIKILGYLEEMEELKMDEEALGIAIRGDREEFIERLSEKIEKSIDLEGSLELARPIELEEKKPVRKRNLKIGLAMDQAFIYHYNENIRILEEAANLSYFSPLKDSSLEDFDMIYLGELNLDEYLDQLAGNKSMLRSIKEFGQSGGYILAQGSALIYLSQSFKSRQLVGLIKGYGQPEKGLSRFGYVDIIMKEDSILGPKGSRLRANEYHRSRLEEAGEEIFLVSKTGGERCWQCAYEYKNSLAFFQNINFLGNRKALDYLLDKIERERVRSQSHS